jgi:hypothetical protein
MINISDADIAQLDAIDAERIDLAERTKALKSEIAERCGISVGQNIECNGYSQTGKLFQIGAIMVNTHGYGVKWVIKCVGLCYKNDGTLGKMRGEWTQPRAVEIAEREARHHGTS